MMVVIIFSLFIMIRNIQKNILKYFFIIIYITPVFSCFNGCSSTNAKINKSSRDFAQKSFEDLESNVIQAR